MSERRDKWMYQELTSEGDIVGPVKNYKFLQSAYIEDAAEAIAKHLDDEEWRAERKAVEDLEINVIDGTMRYIKIAESPGVWVIFEVQLEIVRKYESSRLEKCPDAPTARKAT